MAQASVHIGRSRFRIHAAVNKSNDIGKMVIAEQSGDSLSAELHAPRFVQALSIRGNSICIAEKSDVERAAENAFVGAKPFESLFGGDGQGLIRDGTFRGPKTGGLHAKKSFVISARTLQLFARVFGVAKCPARERCS